MSSDAIYMASWHRSWSSSADSTKPLPVPEPMLQFYKKCSKHLSLVWVAGLDIKARPHHVDLVSGHINFCGYVPERASDFSVWACTVLIFPVVYISFTGLVQILAGHMKFFAGHVNFQNHVPDGHVNQMLNVKPWSGKITNSNLILQGVKWDLKNYNLILLYMSL